jgi:hypothetical protein
MTLPDSESKPRNAESRPPRRLVRSTKRHGCGLPRNGLSWRRQPKVGTGGKGRNAQLFIQNQPKRPAPNKQHRGLPERRCSQKRGRRNVRRYVSGYFKPTTVDPRLANRGCGRCREVDFSDQTQCGIAGVKRPQLWDSLNRQRAGLPRQPPSRHRAFRSAARIAAWRSLDCFREASGAFQRLGVPVRYSTSTPRS